MTRRIAWALLVLAAAVPLASAAMPTGEARVPTYVQPAEDDPGWNCATMGNGRCGPGPLGRRQ